MEKKPHVLCIPVPGQGHINPMMQLAKVLHSRGFLVTFVNTSFIHERLIKSGGLECMEGFWFESIHDGWSTNAMESLKTMEDGEEAFKNMLKNSAEPFRELLRKLQNPCDGRPPLTCAVCDGFLPFALKIVKEEGVANVVLFPAAACAFMSFLHYPQLTRRGLVPLKDESYIGDGYLSTTVDWIPGMGQMQLKDLGSFLATTDPNHFFFNYVAHQAQNCVNQATTIIFNTFDELEHNVVDALQSMPLHIYTIGPLSLHCSSLTNSQMKSVKSSMWAEQRECIEWLDNFKAGSVIYVNFGSTTIMTSQQFQEFAWGIAHSKHPFLWVIRPGLVMNGQTNLSQEFMDEIQGRGMLATWCPQVEVLSHPSVAVFLTHCGWNSTLESIALGVPMLCWPFFCDQQIDCYFACKEWGVGIEINNNASRDKVGNLIKEFMEGEKGKEIRSNASKWRRSAQAAISKGGSSQANLELLLNDLRGA